MEALEAIFTRRSIRSYTDEPITDETMQLLIKAAMSGPSCVNARDWSFIIVRSRVMLNKMADANGRPAEPLRSAAAAVMVCGDLNRSFPPAKDYWVIDGAIAAQNIVLAAHALGLGSVWLGTWPQKERVEAQAKLFGLPESIVPHSVIALGYPLKEPVERDVFEVDRVHMEKW